MESSTDDITSSFKDLAVESDSSENRLPPWAPQNPHKFQPRHFSAITACEHCGHTIVALEWNQGVACTECNFDAHKECAPKVPHNCEGADPKSTFATLNKNPDYLVKHNFYLKHFDTITFCNICRKVLLGIGKQGHACAVCKYVVHEECMAKAADNCAPCRFSSPVPKDFCHYWIEGNLDGKCHLCNVNLAASTIMFGYRCFWCQQKVCSSCFASAKLETDTCDLGELKNSIIPPTCIDTHGKDDDVSSWTVSNLPPNCEPLIVFINRKSGGGMGEFVIRRLNAILNPSQVFDLSKGGPKPALTMLAKCGIKPYRILACGGDGTAGWVFQSIDDLKLEYRPPLAHLPLGTANDLSRVTGMGPKYSGEDLLPIVRGVIKSDVVQFDRWTLDMEINGAKQDTKYFNNYFSVGLDALIALEFHEARNKNPEQFKSVVNNFAKYVQLAASKLVASEVSDLDKILKVKIDGKDTRLPEGTQEILIINIQSYMAGTDAWGDATDEVFPNKQSFSDGLIEVVTVSSVIHLGQLQAGANTGLRIAQCKSVEIEFVTEKNDDGTIKQDLELPVQADGEPWKVKNAKIQIGYHGPSRIILRQ